MMRVLLLVLTVAVAALIIEPGAAGASGMRPQAESAVSFQAQGVDDNDDTRVEVQLIVLAIALGTVVVFGTAAYFLRKKLGLVPPPPEQEADPHH